jgi:hypothetical protein
MPTMYAAGRDITSFGANLGSIAISLIIFVCVFGGAMLGTFLRTVIPRGHLSDDSKESIRLGMGLVATVAALVLGLLIASAKNCYDVQSNALTQMSANALVLDRILAHYGPEAKGSRNNLRSQAIRMRSQLWPKDRSQISDLAPLSASGNDLVDDIQDLVPVNDKQRSLQAQALSFATSIGQTRWLMYEQSAISVPFPLLVVLVFWLVLTFISFGLFAPGNVTVFICLVVSALAVSGAVFLILEMYAPFGGLIQIASGPLQAAIDHLGQ